MKILIADGNPEARNALRLVLEQTDHLIVSEVLDVVGLMAQITTTCPEVVFLDIDLPGLYTGKRQAALALIDLINMLHQFCPQICILALSSRPNEQKNVLAAGADAFFCKSDPPDALLALLNAFSPLHKNP